MRVQSHPIKIRHSIVSRCLIELAIQKFQLCNCSVQVLEQVTAQPGAMGFGTFSPHYFSNLFYPFERLRSFVGVSFPAIRNFKHYLSSPLFFPFILAVNYNGGFPWRPNTVNPFEINLTDSRIFVFLDVNNLSKFLTQWVLTPSLPKVGATWVICEKFLALSCGLNIVAVQLTSSQPTEIKGSAQFMS